MKVLIVGATGFIGTHLVTAFEADGHETWGAGRARGNSESRDRWIEIDFTAPRPTQWARALEGFDVVVNAVGILRDRGRQTLHALHVAGPEALFSAAQSAGVGRIVQISALGAEANAIAAYHRTKHAADRFLLSLPIDAVIVQPSLVYGPEGNSAQMFEALASMPVILLPGDGRQQVQPVHIDDLAAGVVSLAHGPLPARVIPVVGPQPLAMRDFLLALRTGLGLPAAPVLPIPRVFMSIAARIGDVIPALLLNRETWGMLERGNTASAQLFEQVLGHPPRPVARFVPPAMRGGRALGAQLGWLIPLLRGAIAAMWFIAGIVSLGPYPVEQSVRLLQQIGIPAMLAPVALMGAACLDLALGALALWPRAPRWIWTAQIALVVSYTVIITWRLPHLWLEPFGPVAKNLPILALLLLLRQLTAVRK